MTKCPACAEHRMHTVREWRDHHPYAGHGYQEGQGFTKPPAEEPHDVLPKPAPATA